MLYFHGAQVGQGILAALDLLWEGPGPVCNEAGFDQGVKL